MNKALEMVRTMINGANEYEKKTGDKNPPVYFSKDNLLIIEQALQRLESIDNANPSEALECLKHIKKYYIPKPCSAKTYDCLETIKQALLKAQENARSEEILQKYYQEGITLDSVRALKKENELLKGQAQEPKHYLKWEDLEFDNNVQVKKYLKVKLGDNIYSAFYYYSFFMDCKTFCISRDTLSLYITNKQFFNDLHLERVEE